VIRDGRTQARQTVPVNVSDDQDIDIASCCVRRCGVRAEDHTEPHAPHGLESLAEHLRDATLSPQQLLNARDARTRRIERPHAKIPDATAQDCTRTKKMFERELRRMWISLDATGDLARV
jgi:hypothetical protein